MAQDDPASAALNAFAGLAARHGLVAGTPERWDRGGGQLGLQSASAEVRVSWESLSAPWVQVGVRGGPRFGLHEIVAARGAAVRLPTAEDSIEVAMGLLAAGLSEVAADLLSGDATGVPALRLARAVLRRRENQAAWGTATGESPRFASRPTLLELFSDAANDGMRTARVYQAVWDWGYPIAEVGRFVGEGAEQIQARLDDWDRSG